MNRLRKLFYQLAMVNTPSGFEYRVIPFIIKKLSFAGFKVAMDKNYNVIAHRGHQEGDKLPVLCAHMDTVNSNKEKTRLRLVYNNLKHTIHTAKCTDVLGGDDKCGIAIILRLAELARSTDLKFAVLFTREEESGVGACALNKAFYDIVNYGIIIDRRGSGDIVNKIYNTTLCTDHFAKWVASNAPSVITTNIMNSCNSDARPMSKFMNTVNISCGYYEPHTGSEYVNVIDMYNSMIWVKNMLDYPYDEIDEKKTV